MANVSKPRKSTKKTTKQNVETQENVEEQVEMQVEVQVEAQVEVQVEAQEPIEAKIPKKRGRKPKGGKIIQNNFSLETNKTHEPNIIMHLKCGESDLVQNSFISSTVYEPNVAPVETFQFDNNKSNDLCYSVIDYGVKENNIKNESFETMLIDSDKKKNTVEIDETRVLWSKRLQYKKRLQ